MIPRIPMYTQRVLIIDDQLETVEILLDEIRDEEIDVIVALSGREGLRKAISKQPDLIILGLTTPPAVGYEMCRYLKGDTRTFDIPVILLSKENTLEDRLKAFALGVIDYISKPFSAQEVRARILAQLSNRQYLQRLAMLYNFSMENTSFDCHNRKLFKCAIDIIQANIIDPPELTELARQVGADDRTLTELFRKYMNMSFFDILIKVRHLKKRYLLSESSPELRLLAEEEIAYHDIENITLSFRRRHGMSLSKYCQMDDGANDALFDCSTP